MNKVFKLLILGVIQYLFMFLFVCFINTDTFVAYDIITLQREGDYPKFRELIFLTIPLLVLLGYLFESYLNTRNEKMTGAPYKMKKPIERVCLVLFVLSSMFCWVSLIIQARFARNGYAEQPYFFIAMFIISIILIIVGRYLLKSVRGECVGINIPKLTKDHSIWRRVNSLMGKLMILSALLSILIIALYELLNNPLIIIIAITELLILSFAIPFIYCVYLNYKSKK